MKDKITNMWKRMFEHKYMNKYVISFVVFTVFVVFFDSNNTIKRFKVKRENQKLKREISNYKDQIERDSATINMFKNNTDNIEKFAREEYNFRCEGEDIYIIEE